LDIFAINKIKENTIMDQQSTQVDIASINEKVAQESQFVELLVNEMNKVIVGQQYMIERLLIGLLGRGHILLEGVPGLAKTLAITTLSKAVSGSFSKSQLADFDAVMPTNNRPLQDINARVILD